MAVNDWLGRLRGSVKEANERLDADERQRREAGRAEKSVILDPRDVQGDYDVPRLLFTTLGGKLRAITADDLYAFRRNIQTVEERYKGGITARQVIDLSHSDGLGDLERARQQITHALPVSFAGGLMRFITNASKGSDVKRHHVLVKFLSFESVAASGKQTPAKAAHWLRKQPLAFDCDCGRHRYWFRYIASIGGFAAGRSESGFPKIRNPGLNGVACKHVLRVMSEIDQGVLPVQNLLERTIDAARNREGNTRVKVSITQAEAEALAKAGKAKTVIKTGDDRKATREAAAERKAAKAAVAGIVKPPKLSVTQRRIQQAVQSGVLSADQVAIMRHAGISDEMIAKMTRK